MYCLFIRLLILNGLRDCGPFDGHTDPFLHLRNAQISYLPPSNGPHISKNVFYTFSKRNPQNITTNLSKLQIVWFFRSFVRFPFTCPIHIVFVLTRLLWRAEGLITTFDRCPKNGLYAKINNEISLIYTEHIFYHFITPKQYSVGH